MNLLFYAFTGRVLLAVNGGHGLLLGLRAGTPRASPYSGALHAGASLDLNDALLLGLYSHGFLLFLDK